MGGSEVCKRDSYVYDVADLPGLTPAECEIVLKVRESGEVLDKEVTGGGGDSIRVGVVCPAHGPGMCSIGTHTHMITDRVQRGTVVVQAVLPAWPPIPPCPGLPCVWLRPPLHDGLITKLGKNYTHTHLCPCPRKNLSRTF